jgi:hypothetical protein
MKPLCKVGWADAISQQAFDLGRIDALGAALIDTPCLGCRDALKLPLAPAVVLEDVSSLILSASPAEIDGNIPSPSAAFSHAPC